LLPVDKDHSGLVSKEKNKERPSLFRWLWG
jgi:hypothetical protein